MVNVIINEDYSNSPIKDFFKNIIIEGLHGNLDFINNILDNKVKLDIIGETYFESKINVFNFLKNLDLNTLNSIRIDTIISHGKDAAVNGIGIDKHDMEYHFCAICTLRLGKAKLLKSITIYII